MLEILPTPDHIAAYRLSGTVTTEELDRLTADVEARLGRHEKIGVFADIAELEKMTPGAVWRDLRYGLSKLGDLRRFPREALVARPGWLRSIAETLSPMVPRVEVRVFGTDEREAALRWAGEIEGGPDA